VGLPKEYVIWKIVKHQVEDMKRNNVAAIIPAYNEEQTVADVVRPLVESSLVHEVIVISDGSTDRTAEVARAASARVIELEVNQGKGESMLLGLKHTNAEFVGFFDADLRGFTKTHIKQLVVPVTSKKRMMNVGLRDKGFGFTSIALRLPLIGGERVMDRRVIEHIDPKLLKGFMVEASLNYYCRSHGYSYGAVVLKNISIRRKYEKVGYVRGVLQYILMFYQVFQAWVCVRIAHMRGKL
jgi:polyisoprenyl-phosphate glycosyltransferase